jgi:DNA-binding IscR family transcriptional regulator
MLVYEALSGYLAKLCSNKSRTERKGGVGTSAGTPGGYDLSQTLSNIEFLPVVELDG